MVSDFGLKPGNNVLDLMCGYGRHALALARKGITVTAVDNLGDYTEEIIKTAVKEKLPLKVVKADVINYEANEMFDLVICMGNSLNFFSAEDTLRLLTKISVTLKTEGHLFINSWSIAEIIFKNYKERSWSQVGNLKFLVECKFHLYPTRIESEHIILTPDGTSESKKGIDYIYSINEIVSLLNSAGLDFNEIYSIPGKKKFTLGEPRAYIVAGKKE